MFANTRLEQTCCNSCPCSTIKLSKPKTVLIETELAEPTNIKIDYKRNIVFNNNVRVAEWWKADDVDKLVINREQMRSAGIKMDPAKLCAAAAEMTQE